MERGEEFSRKLTELLGGLGFGGRSWTSERLLGDGSDREFYRIHLGSDFSLIAVYNPGEAHQTLKENMAYLKIGEHFKGMPGLLPKIYGSSGLGELIVVEDLGDTRLFDLVGSGKEFLPYYEEAIEKLWAFQTQGIRGFDTHWCSQSPVYDEEVMLQKECLYFKRAFLEGVLGLRMEEDHLIASFYHIIDKAKEAEGFGLIHRDFQSRNIMVGEKGLRFVDWQGARIGPGGYDLASLLVDPYVSLDKGYRLYLYELYLCLFQTLFSAKRPTFERSFPYLMLLRNLQILGAFGFLYKVKGKPFFRAFIRPALDSLLGLIREMRDEGLSPLEDVAVIAAEVWTRQEGVE
ncbi:MAG: phosphotransferase [Desulfatiglandales bacterium]